jgi:hypothetical protein
LPSGVYSITLNYLFNCDISTNLISIFTIIGKVNFTNILLEDLRVGKLFTVTQTWGSSLTGVISLDTVTTIIPYAFPIYTGGSIYTNNNRYKFTATKIA